MAPWGLLQGYLPDKTHFGNGLQSSVSPPGQSSGEAMATLLPAPGTVVSQAETSM